ncbi:hypothetical protein ACMFMG_008413 [Clarireedia jacksonii]
MLGSITRQGHRVQQALRTPARFSTTTRNREAENTGTPAPKGGSNGSADESNSSESKIQRRIKSLIKRQTRRSLRQSTRERVLRPVGGEASKKTRKSNTDPEPEVSEQLDSSGSPEAISTTKKAKKAKSEEKKAKSVKTETKSAKKSTEEKRQKSLKHREQDEEASADGADVEVIEPRVRKVKNRLLKFISAGQKDDSSKKVAPSQLHSLFQDLVATKGESTARRQLVELIQSGGLTTSDRGKVMKELRASLIRRQAPAKETPPRSNAAQTLAGMLAAYESVHDAMKNGRPPKRSEAATHDGTKGRKRPGIGPGPGKTIRTGPIPLPSGSKQISFQVQSVDASSLSLTPVQKRQPPVPGLSYGLERALFNPGVYHLQDPRSRVFNFDPYLQTIMPVSEFDFTALKQYITSSRDTTLIDTAIAEGKKYTGSTSSMTASLAHFHFLLSQWRPINTGMLSQDFPVEYNSFTVLQRGPSAIFLRWRNGTYAIDADKEYDNANILSMLGKSMEKLLTIPKEEFEQYRKVNSDQITEDQRNEVESFHYTSMGDFLMRSQLDAHDPRLPGTGMFDLKTRAVVSIRMDIDEYEQGSGYQIHGRHGEWESFEREYYDMIRAAFLKYSLQVRMGRMDGIFVAFHNVERIFGFQYISLPEMDYALHGANDTTLGDAEFKLSLDLLNRALDRATAKFPEKSLRIHFETRGNTETPFMYIFAEPIEEDEIQKIQDTNKAAIEEFERRVLGLHQDKSENELLEEKKNAEWADLRAQVEESMEKDELDAKNARAIAENLLARHEVTGLTLEEVEQRVEDFLAASQYNENDDEDDEDENDTEDRVMEEEEEEEDEEDDDDEGEENDESDENDEENDEDDDEEEHDRDEDAEEHETDETEKNISSEINEVTLVETQGLLVDPAEEATDSAAVSTETESTDTMKESSNEGQDGEPGAIEQENSPESQEASDKANDVDYEVTDEDTGEKILGTALDEEDSKEILAMHLTIRNKVDGEYVVRPERLSKEQNWTVEYALTEIDGGVKSMNLYKACKARRRTALTKSEQKEEDVRNNLFIENLKRLADKGRQWRKQQDEVERNLPVKTLDYREEPKEVGILYEQPTQPTQPTQPAQSAEPAELTEPEHRAEENKIDES